MKNCTESAQGWEFFNLKVGPNGENDLNSFSVERLWGISAR